MRLHRFAAAVAPWAHDPALRDLATPASLAVMRIEPVTRGREPAAVADLVFERDGAIGVVALAIVDFAQLDVREFDPLVFPAAYADRLDEATVAEVNRRLIDELEIIAFRGGLREERIIRYADLPAFDEARARGALGAAPLVDVVPHLAPAVYARRFARQARVTAFGSRAVEAAALVRDLAAELRVTEADPALERWYGPCAAAATTETVDLAIGSDGDAPAAVVTVRAGDAGPHRVGVAAALPLDRLFAFGESDARGTAISVDHRREPARRPDLVLEPRRVGGSAGRIAVVVRPDAALVPDADVDEAHALADYLRGEGFEPVVVSSLEGLDAAAPDLVHLFGIAPGGYALDVCSWAKERAIPLAIHAYDEAPERGGWWGATVTPFCFGYSVDDRSIVTYLDLLARRAVEVDGIGPHAVFAPPALDLLSGRRALRVADVVFVHSEREREAVAVHRPGLPVLVVPPLPLASRPGATIGALVGSEPFVLVHAPLAAAMNQLAIVRAATSAGMPVVLAGPVQEPEYAERLQAMAGDTVFLPEPDAATRTALYAAAAVAADAAWVTRGHARLATAAAAGAIVVSSRNRWIDLGLPERRLVDPADGKAIARGIGAAVDAAARGERPEAAAVQARLTAAGAAVVGGYAKIASTV